MYSGSADQTPDSVNTGGAASDSWESSVYSHIKTKAELLHEIVIETLDALLALQHYAIGSTDDCG
jgi:hypothetical protein